MKEIRRDFTVTIRVPDYIGVDDIEMVATIEASYADQAVEPMITAEEAYVVEPEPPELPKPVCPKCAKEIDYLSVRWPALVTGIAEFSNDGLNVDFVDGINDLSDIAQEDEQTYHCPECNEQLFKAGDEDRIADFLKNESTLSFSPRQIVIKENR